MSNYATLVSLLIQGEVKGHAHHERILNLGMTPEVLIKHAGFSQLELIIKASTISKIHFDHGIKESLIKELPEILQNPKAIYSSATHPGNAVVVTFEQHLSAPVIAIARKNMQVGRITYNGVVSMYAKEGPSPERKWEKDGLLLWGK